MAEAEAKLRKLAASTSTQSEADVAVLSAECCAEDATRKGKRKGLRCLPSWQGLKQFIARRGDDMAGISFLWMWVAGGTYVARFLMDPPDALLIRILRPLFYAFWCLFVLSWLGVIYHGPGRPASESSAEKLECGEESRLSSPLVAAMTVGKLGRAKPFSAESTYCERCRLWKHPFAHHCAKCNACSLWMDHHCGLCGQCVGFRNLRCFMVWLVHAAGLFWCLILLTLHYLWLNGGWPEDYWCLRWLAWFWYIAMTGRQAGGHLVSLILQLAGGWHGRVLRKKFEILHLEACRLQQRLGALNQSMGPEHPSRGGLQEVIQDLDTALENLCSGIKLPAEGGGAMLMWGPFLGKELQPITTAFGEPLSWRWLLPLVPGGGGDPLAPEGHSERGCEAWLALEAAMHKAADVYAPIFVAQREQEERWEAMLANLGK